MAVRRDAAVERMASLTFALLGVAQQSKKAFRTASWIQRNVPGYPQENDGKDGNAAFRKQLQRDIQMLRLAGVPVIYRKGSGTDESTIRIDEDSYRLPEVEFTPAEATVLALAGGLGQEGGLSVFSQTGWTKMAAAGNSKLVPGAPWFSASHDLKQISPRDFLVLILSIERKVGITMSYRRSPIAEPMQRTLDPWGLVTRQGRVYLVGWDHDRRAERSFRITRISKIERQVGEFFTMPSRPLAEMVEEFVGLGEQVDALVRIPSGTAVELSSLGTRREDGLVELKGVSADWLVRTAVGFAPEVEVVEPESVREEIRSLLHKAVNHGA